MARKRRCVRGLRLVLEERELLPSIPPRTDLSNDPPTDEVDMDTSPSQYRSVSDTASPSTIILLKKRGRNIDHPDDHPPPGQRFVVEWAENYQQPKGDTARPFKKRINNLAKRNEIFPLDVCWTKQSKKSFILAWDYITAEYDLNNSPNAEYYIFGKMADTWRVNRNRIKKRYWSRYVDDPMPDNMYHDLPPFIDPDQFRNCVTEWNSDRAKEISRINKNNRMKKTNDHKTGSTSFSKVRENLMDEGIEPTRIHTLIRVYGPENKTIKQIVDHYHSDDIQRLLVFMSREELEQICIEKFMPSKKKRVFGLGTAPYLENSASSSRFSRQINMKEKGKEKVNVEDVHQENLKLKVQMQMLMDKLKSIEEERDPSRMSNTSRGSYTFSCGSSPTNDQDSTNPDANRTPS